MDLTQKCLACLDHRLMKKNAFAFSSHICLLQTGISNTCAQCTRQKSIPIFREHCISGMNKASPQPPLTVQDLCKDLRDLLRSTYRLRQATRASNGGLGLSIVIKASRILARLEQYGISDGLGRYVEACMMHVEMCGRLDYVRDPSLLQMIEDALWRVVRWDYCIANRLKSIANCHTDDNVNDIGTLNALPNCILYKIANVITSE